MTRAYAILLLLCVVACNDPVRNRTVDELGGEAAGVPPGPLHRPGQPCLVCHGGQGPADGEFSLAGTLFQKPEASEPLHDARVRFIDETGAQYTSTSNCAGNFYVRKSNYAPAWPVWTKVEFADTSVEMRSAMFRGGDCGSCHEDPASPDSAGHVCLVERDSTFAQEHCP